MPTTLPTKLSLRDTVLLLRRQLRLIVAVLAIGILGASLFLARTTPIYSATALVLVEPANNDILRDDASAPQSGASLSARVESEAEILRSGSIALMTIDTAGLLHDPEFGPSLTFRSKMMQALGWKTDPPISSELVGATLLRLQRAVDIRRRTLTNLIAITVSSEAPQKASSLSNELAANYLALQIEAKVNATLTARSILTEQLAAAQAGLVSSEEALNDYVVLNLDRLVLESGDEGVGAMSDEVLELRGLGESLRQRTAGAREALGREKWDQLTSTLQDEALEALNQERGRLAIALSQQPENAQSANLEAELDALEGALGQAALTSIGQLEAALSSTATEEKEQVAEISRAVMGGPLSAETLSELYTLRQEATLAQHRYDTLLARVRQLETQALVQVADARVVSPALVPVRPTFPDKRLTLGLALFASLALGVGLAFLNELYVGGIHSARQLANILPIRVGAAIPLIPKVANPQHLPDQITRQPMSRFSESFRQLRAAIDRLPKDTATGRVILVTSTAPTEGKSVTSLSLGRTYAQAGFRTLVIDADLRRPALAQLMGVQIDAGLLEFLSSPGADILSHDALVEDPLSGMSVLLGQGNATTPTDQVLQSNTFMRLIEGARAAFDVIIIDTAPVLPVVDARYIAAHCDCAVICVRAAKTGQVELRSAHEILSDCLPKPKNSVAALTFLTDGVAGYGAYHYEVATD